MKKTNNVDLVAGRLSRAAAAAQESAAAVKPKPTAYLSNRLGICAEEPPRETNAPWEHPVALTPAPQPQPQPERHEESHADNWEQQFAGLSLQHPQQGKRRKQAAIAGVSAAAMLVLAVVGFKIFAPSGAAPQAVAAAPRIARPAPVAPSAEPVTPVKPAQAVESSAAMVAVMPPSAPPQGPPVLQGDWGDVPGQASQSAQPAPPSAPRYVICPPGLRLRGVVRQPDGSRLANINGKFVRVGDRISGASVVSITDFSVEMQLNEDRFFVAFASDQPPPEDPDAIEQEESSDSRTRKKESARRKPPADEDSTDAE